MTSKSPRTYIFFFFLLIIFKMHSQVNILGKPGYMTTPSADWIEGRQLGFVFSYIPAEYSGNILYTPKITTSETPLRFYNVRADLTSFFEVNLSIAYRPQISDKIGVGDRQLDFRFRLLKEKKFWPSLVLGWTPPGSASPGLSHDYLVVTKHFSSSVGELSATLGYGSPLVFVKNQSGNFLDFNIQKKTLLYGDYLNGIYGGLSYMPVNFGGIMIEYDTKTVNSGAFIKIKDWLYFQAYTFEGKEFAFTTSINLSLNFSPNILRKYAKELD